MHDFHDHVDDDQPGNAHPNHGFQHWLSVSIGHLQFGLQGFHSFNDGRVLHFERLDHEKQQRLE